VKFAMPFILLVLNNDLSVDLAQKTERIGDSLVLCGS